MKFFKAENTKKDWWLPNCWIQLYGRHGICTGWRFKRQKMDNGRRRVYICLKKGVYHPISPIILTTFLPSSVRRYRRPLWASSLMQTIKLCSFKSVSTLLTCFIPTPDSSLIFVGILTSFFKVSSTFRL